MDPTTITLRIVMEAGVTLTAAAGTGVQKINFTDKNGKDTWDISLPWGTPSVELTFKVTATGKTSKRLIEFTAPATASLRASA